MAFSNENQRLTFVTGKGGVGKSTIAAAYAESLAKNGKKTLLVELGESSYFRHVYGLNVAYEPNAISENLYVSLWNGEECLKEYVNYIVKVKQVVELFFNNKVMKTFIKAAPALKELAILGKITSGIRGWGPKLSFDHIVVDCFATGHFLALVRAPLGMSQLFESGPMGEQSRSIMQVLRRPDLCDYIVVTLLEELPVTETIELTADIFRLLQIKSTVIANKYYESYVELGELKKFTESSNGANDFSIYLLNLLSRQKKYIKVLEENYESVKKVPMIFSSQGRDLVDFARGSFDV